MCACLIARSALQFRFFFVSILHFVKQRRERKKCCLLKVREWARRPGPTPLQHFPNKRIQKRSEWERKSWRNFTYHASPNFIQCNSRFERLFFFSFGPVTKIDLFASALWAACLPFLYNWWRETVWHFLQMITLSPVRVARAVGGEKFDTKMQRSEANLPPLWFEYFERK